MILLAAGGVLIVLVARILGARIEQWWEQAKVGGQILVHPRAYMGRVLFPEVLSWIAMLGIIAVFLAAYAIPVSFHTVMRVVAGNSMANMTSVTPGGAGVTQGFNVLSLKGITSTANATAYSVAQQLVTTAWSIFFAIIMVVRTFGWSGGRTLVEQSYSEAKEKSAEQSAARKAKRQASKEERQAKRQARRRGQRPGPLARRSADERDEASERRDRRPRRRTAATASVRLFCPNQRLTRSRSVSARSGTTSSISIGSSISHSITPPSRRGRPARGRRGIGVRDGLHGRDIDRRGNEVEG